VSAGTLIATQTGLRGRPGEGLTDAVVRDAVGGFAALLADRRLPATVTVARDDRATSHDLAARTIGWARDAGLDVTDLGVASTPAAKLAARRRGLGGAIVITASHLAGDWNGLKLSAGPDALPVDAGALPPPVPAGRRGALQRVGAAADEHAEALCASVDRAAIAAARLTVACAGGAGPGAAIAIERLGCRVATGPADLGLRLDPDADRLQLVDEHGADLDPEATLALVAIARGARSVVKGADTSTIVDELVAGPVHVVSPGELHLAEAVLETGAELAGEGNGGVMLPAVGLARDGLAAAAAVLELVARTGRPLSALAGELPRRAMRRSTVPVTSPERVARALAALGGEPPSDPFAGVRVERPGGVWGLVRQAATEPVLRITVEAPDPAAADHLHDELWATIQPVGSAPR
jgi:phosphomannomutase